MRCPLKLCWERGEFFASHCREGIPSICGITFASMSWGHANMTFPLLSKRFLAPPRTLQQVPFHWLCGEFGGYIKSAVFTSVLLGTECRSSFRNRHRCVDGYVGVGWKIYHSNLQFFLNGVYSNVKTLGGCYLQFTDLSSGHDIKVILLRLQYAFVKGTDLHDDSEFP